MRIDAKLAGGAGHQLAQTDGADRAQRCRIVGALDLDICPVEECPIGDRQSCTAQGSVTSIAQGGCLDGVEDFRRGAHGTRRRCGDRDRDFTAFRLGKEEEPVSLCRIRLCKRAQCALLG